MSKHINSQIWEKSSWALPAHFGCREGRRRESISYVLREGWFSQAVSPGNVSQPVGLQTAEVQGHVTTGQGSEFG